MTKNQQAMKAISPLALSTDRLPGLKRQIHRRIRRREDYLGHLKQLNAQRILRRNRRRNERLAAKMAEEAKKKAVCKMVEAVNEASDALQKLLQRIRPASKTRV